MNVKRGSLVVVASLALFAGCKTVTREPVAFVTESYHAAGNEQYQFGGWVRGESCEDYTTFILSGGNFITARAGDREVPRQTQQALAAALTQKPDTVFLADMSVETETRNECFGFKVCTVVTGAAMQSAEMRSRHEKIEKPERSEKPDAPPPAPAPKPKIVPDDDASPSRVLKPK